uniref:Uncharacterized protein n=1 Tax=Sphaerodactylus townsendi TaxID=933632 RepID=A0ACB8FYT6_9SAUR
MLRFQRPTSGDPTIFISQCYRTDSKDLLCDEQWLQHQQREGPMEVFSVPTMALLLLLFTYCTGAFAQFVLTQPSSTSASLGESVRIPCVRSSGSITSDYVSWYQQKPDSAPKLLIYEYSKRHTGTSDRFSGATDSSANSASLTISSVRAEDEADYYCLSYAGSGKYTVIQPTGEVRQKPP